MRWPCCLPHRTCSTAGSEKHSDAVLKIEKNGETPELAADKALWPNRAPSGIVNLGLDLRGGAHLLAEVQTQDVYKARMNGLWPELRKSLADERATLGGVRRVPGPEDELRVQIEKPDGVPKALELAWSLASPVITLTGVGQKDFEARAEGNQLIISLSDAEKAATDDRTMQQSLEIIRRRVDEVGTREPTIQREGQNRISIQVPGIGSAEELKNLIGTTAKLTFQPVVSRTTDPNTLPGPGNVILPSVDEQGVFYVLEDTPVVTGEVLSMRGPSSIRIRSLPWASGLTRPGRGSSATIRPRTWASCLPSCWTTR